MNFKEYKELITEISKRTLLSNTDKNKIQLAVKNMKIASPKIKELDDGLERLEYNAKMNPPKLSTEKKNHRGYIDYDPKTKETLPYYARFPLTIMVGPAPKGFYGLNLHYLPLDLRAKLLDSLLDTINNKRYDESTRFRLSYDMLNRASKMRAFKPCFKRYLTSHVRSRLARVDAPEWEIATFLPTADFEKASLRKVYSDSRRKINA